MNNMRYEKEEKNPKKCYIHKKDIIICLMLWITHSIPSTEYLNTNSGMIFQLAASLLKFKPFYSPKEFMLI